ncbi:hypothetical protein MGYG_04248 [Nannizzia gypsea CBS 118893]|uniref:Uncharacterized protein n=1 Tax=Arthroderma gypseum (strain ATCC MYA-4604 / CBS 118893) TaxID=535722 RepID=E4URY7_ARTGP|nr:hypothetical protein MGYG_04248 [Nannizzia gypsea CBS 118893]EFR01244.1 hypothetical protein MGYG_04248 [Nannizzia gypsea CBS 118893]
MESSLELRSEWEASGQNIDTEQPVKHFRYDKQIRAAASRRIVSRRRRRRDVSMVRDAEVVCPSRKILFMRQRKGESSFSCVSKTADNVMTHKREGRSKYKGKNRT